MSNRMSRILCFFSVLFFIATPGSGLANEPSSVTVELSMNEGAAYYGLTVSIIPPAGLDYRVDSCTTYSDSAYPDETDVFLNAASGEVSIMSTNGERIPGPFDVMKCIYDIGESFEGELGEASFGVAGDMTTSGSGDSVTSELSEFTFAIIPELVHSTVTLDVDEDGDTDANDGLMILRKFNGLPTVDDGVLLPDGVDNGQVIEKINQAGDAFDVDRDGDTDANDGLMILRKLNGLPTVNDGVLLADGTSNEDVVDVIKLMEIN